MNPKIPAAVAERFPMSDRTPGDRAALRALADKVEGLAGGDQDGTGYTAGVAQTLRWLAEGTTASEFLSIVITATDAD